MALGQRDDEPDEARFNMAVMGLRLAARANGVAKLHGVVSRSMFAGLWPDVPVDEVPITSITNGVHAPTWVAPEIDALLSRYVLPDWVGAGEADWARAADIRDDELWRAASRRRERLVTFVREHLRGARLAQGVSVERRRLDRRPCSTRRCSRSASPGGSPPTSGPPCCSRSPTGCRSCCSPPTDPSSSCSPARPTRPTTPGKEMIQQIAGLRLRPRRAPPVRLHRRLRHLRGPRALSRASTCGSTPRGDRWRPAAPAA